MVDKRKKKLACPVCKTKSQKKLVEFFPFCSERCKLLDLGAWLEGDYKIPVEPYLEIGRDEIE